MPLQGDEEELAWIFAMSLLEGSLPLLSLTVTEALKADVLYTGKVRFVSHLRLIQLFV